VQYHILGTVICYTDLEVKEQELIKSSFLRSSKKLLF